MSDLLAGTGRSIGARAPRTEDRRLLTGRGSFVDDVDVPGVLHAAFARSDVARGRITRLDVEAARRFPGVVAVMTAAELNPMVSGRMGATPVLDRAGFAPEHPLAEDVRFVGDPFAIVVATSRAIAEDAIDLIEIEIDPLPPVVDYSTAARSDELVHAGERADNVASVDESPIDDELSRVLEHAPYLVTIDIVQNRYLPVPMEPRGVLAWWDPRRHELRIWASTQAPHDVRAVASRIAGVPLGQVRVTMGDVGGGFGQKAFLGRDEQVVILASRFLGRPVKWIEDRRENLIAASSARAERCTCTIAADDDGRILGMHVDHVDEAGAYPLGGSAAGMGMRVLSGPYRVPKAAWRTMSVWTNTCARAPYRGPWQIETLAREQMVDALARKMSIDALELRRRNVVHRDELPYTMPSGWPLFDVSPQETLEQAAEMIGYDSFRRHQASVLAEGRLLGIGISLYVEPQIGVGPYGNEPAHVRVQPDGSVDAYIGAGGHGQGLETTTAQLVAGHLGVRFEDVRVHMGDTAETPYSIGTGGSRSGPVMGAAIRQAALAVRGRALAIAANMLEASPDDLEIAESVITVRGTPARSLPFAAVAHAAYFDVARLPDGAEPGLDVVSRCTAPNLMYSNACHACIVEIDPVTGMVEIVRYVVSEDCGQMINPSVVEGQIAGGAVQGIGGVLFEEFVYDADGNPLTTTFLDYLLPTAGDVPTIEYGHIETPAATPGSYKGVGEGGAIGAPAAIANAVNDALAQIGVQVHVHPLSPCRLSEAIAARG
jgi:aerobic carbon-monoxide dehydrogenase large subunit